MADGGGPHRVDTIEKLEALYGTPGAAARAKVSARITPEYRRLIEAAPFVALATVGPEGLDCSPRGDAGQALAVEDERTLVLPDRRGNNRIDSLRNIVRDPRVGLLALIPGLGISLRINGRAHLSADPAALDRHAVEGRAPRTLIVVTVEEIYFQCARAIMRAGLWDPARHVDPQTLPSPGAVLASLSEGFDAATYDAEWPQRAAGTMW